MHETCIPPFGALFDLDGVLVDSEGIYSDFWHDVNCRFPTGIDNFEYVIKGNTLGNILEKYFPNPDTQSQILVLLKKQEAEMRYTLFDGVEDFLRKLRLAGIVSAIVTSSNVRKMDHLFAQIPSLRPLVDIIITEEDVTYSKPHPQGYNLAAERLGISPKRCVVFEDSMAGVEAGRRAGGAVVGIATTNPAERLMEFADMVVESVAELDISMFAELIDG